ncbi:galectin-3-like [Portunus trituberculatus]|uniref:galectin-3-like n=1 Tax=Portunus trituberculatus TaxID=210409 RepID=UPI001E1CE6CC|nr:galectin-3-like [Portunus trituberculatus]
MRLLLLLVSSLAALGYAEPDYGAAPVHTLPGKVPVHTLPAKLPVQTLPGKVPVHPLPVHAPVQTLPGKLPVQTLPGKVPVHTLPGKLPVQTLPGHVPVQTLPGKLPVHSQLTRPHVSPLRPQLGLSYGSRASCRGRCPASLSARAICCRRWGSCCTNRPYYG